MESIVQDVRFGLRSLRKNWVFTVTAVLTLGVGVGATTSVFSVANGVLFRPLPYPEPDRLATIETNTGGPGWYGSSQPEFLDFQESLGSFESLGAYGSAEVTLSDSTASRRVEIGIVTAEVLPLLGVSPARGRFFAPEEDLPGGPRVALIGHSFWRDELGSDPEVLGTLVALAGQSWTVVGVMPAGFGFPNPDVVAWLPYRLDPANPTSRSNHSFAVIGRLEREVTYEVGTAELAIHTARIRDLYPDNYEGRGYRTRLQSLHENMVGSTRSGILLLLGGALLVLVVACVNVSNLSLARGEARETELAIRGALGAGRTRVVRQLLIESGILAVAGGVAGLALGWGALRGLLAIAPEGLPRLGEIGLDRAAVLTSFAVVALSVLLFGLAPAFRSVRSDLRSALFAGRGSSGRRSGALRRMLVVSQLSLAGLLAIGAGTMVRTLANLYDVDLGFRPEHTLTFDLSPNGARYPQPEEAVALYESIVPRLAALPGVLAVGAHAATPLGPERGNLSLVTEDRPNVNISNAPDSRLQISTPGYFEAMGIELRSGRLFTAADRAATTPVIVINEMLAQTLWPGEEPLGKRFRMFAEGWPYMEVIGVVANVRHAGPDQPAPPRYYAPHAQAYQTAYFSPLRMSLTLRAEGDPASLAAAVRSAIQEIDATAPISDVRTMETRLTDSVSDRRFVSSLLQAFGLVALLLAALGVYGVMSLAVSERARELGLRKALGAPRKRLIGIVLRESLLLATIGAGLAIVGGVVFGRVMGSLLFEVTPANPVTLGLVAVTLVGTAALAALIPAARASRVDPMEVLRAEG